MAKYKITEDNVKSLIDWKETIKKNNCEVKVRSGTFSEIEGHEGCPDCPGNYWNGGKCHYKESSVEHTLKGDLDSINNYFGRIDRISNDSNDLRASEDEEEFNDEKQNLMVSTGKVRDACDNNKKLVNSFFKDTCLTKHVENVVFTSDVIKRFENLSKGLEKYIGKISAITYYQFVVFKKKLINLDKLLTEKQINKEEYNNLPNTLSRRNLARTGELQNRINRISMDIKDLIKELDAHPAIVLFDSEIVKILANSKKELFEPSSRNPFAGLSKEKGNGNYMFPLRESAKTDNNNDNTDNGDNNETPSKGWPWGKIALYGVGGLVVVIGLVWIYKWSKSKVS